MTDKIIAAVEPLLAVLRSHESADNYDAVWGGIKAVDRPPRPLTQMTVGAVLDWQDSIDARYRSEAAGAYQILEDTLRGLYRQAGVPLTAIYDRATQDRLALALLRRRGLDDFLAGRMRAEAFALSLAKEWASLPVPHDIERGGRTVRAGQSYYAGDGLNKAHAGIDEVMAALRAIDATPEPAPKDVVTARLDKAIAETAKAAPGLGAGGTAGYLLRDAPTWAIDAAWGLGLFLAAAVGLLVVARLWKGARGMMPRVTLRAGSVEFRCPGCGWTHMLNTDPAQSPCWVFNGDVRFPTLSPSINASRIYTAADRADERCHSFVTDGRIGFLDDSTHALAGQTIDLPEVAA